MVYSLSQIYSKEKEKLLRENNPVYEELRIYKARENRALVSAQTKQRTAEKVKCQCGCILAKSSLPKHRKTPKHNKLMDQKIKLKSVSKE